MGKKRRNYDSGADAERYVKRALEGRGMKVVRSAGSRGAADLIAADSRVCYAIQVKRYHLTEKKLAKEARILVDWIEDALYMPMIVHKKTSSSNSPYEYVQIREVAEEG